ncbi:hypothetical protein [Clostridium disporicum]
MKKINIIGYSYDWIPIPSKESELDKELSQKQNEKFKEYTIVNLVRN